MNLFSIDPDITKATTLPALFYRDRAIFEAVKEKIFSRTWLYAADASVVKVPGDLYPFTLLEQTLDEPLLLTRDQQGIVHCLPNVCTHRGKILVDKPCKRQMLTCGYHGRCFRLDGSFKSMPGFEDAVNFPTPEDDLKKLAVKEWLGLLFISLDPAFSLEEAIHPVIERIDPLLADQLIFDETSSVSFQVNANWALYCDNYLEGFHIPFVHPALNQAIEFGKYAYELFPFCNLQVGVAKEGEPHFELPEGHPDFGKKIYAYYFWLFPNLMFNFYPWGLSLNIVEPLSHERTRVVFRTYRFKDRPFNRDVNNLERTELEDEAVVESVQQGIRSRFYNTGRFSPKMEKGVHHFHRLIDIFLSENKSS